MLEPLVRSKVHVALWIRLYVAGTVVSAFFGTDVGVVGVALFAEGAWCGELDNFRFSSFGFWYVVWFLNMVPRVCSTLNNIAT